MTRSVLALPGLQLDLTARANLGTERIFHHMRQYYPPHPYLECSMIGVFLLPPSIFSADSACLHRSVLLFDPSVRAPANYHYSFITPANSVNLFNRVPFLQSPVNTGIYEVVSRMAAEHGKLLLRASAAPGVQPFTAARALRSTDRPCLARRTTYPRPAARVEALAGRSTHPGLHRAGACPPPHTGPQTPPDAMHPNRSVSFVLHVQC